MTVEEVIAALELDKETADILKSKVKAEKAAAFRQQKDLDAIQTKANELEKELVGDGKTGSRNYQQWYQENYPKVQALQVEYAKYVERYGALNGQTNNAPANPNPPASGLTREDVAKLIQETYTPQWSNLLKGSGKIIEKHIRAGRKTELDWDKLSEIAATKGGDLGAAYDEWDKPAREEYEKSAREAEIEKRVKAELAKRQSDNFFPSTEVTSSGVSPLSRTRDDSPKYDRSKVLNAAITGLYEPQTVQ